ncbi:hypothetical protein WA026_005577 [Henosepilachna vigintioctopunctata]|uniref:Serpin domain-containing protein n=1 Tax=Henosepilachna vigintioctopunctata TaxID=420089 RepID=A0AAW1U1K5_9CUCU
MKILVLFLLVNYVVGYEDPAFKDLAQSNNAFSSKLHKELSKSKAENFIVSPFSAETILALTALGAKGGTATELFRGLCLPPDPQRVKDQFSSVRPYIKTGRFSTLLTANRIYVENGFGIVPEFIETSGNYFDADIQNVNFGQTEETSLKINNWVESKTNGKIKKLVSSDILNELTRVVLVNALYFKGIWVNPFRKQHTQLMGFYNTPTDIVQVQTMQSTAYREYADNDDLDATFVNLPYVGTDLHLNLVIPKKVDGLNSIESKMDLVLKPQNYTKETIKLFLPKFKVEMTMNLVPSLQNLGITRLFNRDADLSGISIKEGLYVSNVVQKVFMNVDERGTEAAAATAVISNARSAAIPRQSKLEIKVDRPFLFFLKLKNMVLFSGRIAVL